MPDDTLIMAPRHHGVFFLVDTLIMTPQHHGVSCDIKDPNGNITWTTPEGMGGPNYPYM